MHGDLYNTGDLITHGVFIGAGVIPIGGIIDYYGTLDDLAANYSNWQICDGTNRTPDLRGLFVMGATNNGSIYDFNNTGGEVNHTLSISEMPRHDHSYNFRFSLVSVQTGLTAGYWSGTMPTLTSKTGGGMPHNNIPPYRCLFKIMRMS